MALYEEAFRSWLYLEQKPLLNLYQGHQMINTRGIK